MGVEAHWVDRGNGGEGGDGGNSWRREKKYKHGWTDGQTTKNEERCCYLANGSCKAEMNNTTNTCIFQRHMT